LIGQKFEGRVARGPEGKAGSRGSPFLPAVGGAALGFPLEPRPPSRGVGRAVASEPYLWPSRPPLIVRSA
jgi:hypothetical protein